METTELVLDALAQLGLAARAEHEHEVVVEPEGAATRLHLRRRSLVTTDVANRLAREETGAGRTLLAVADRITGDAREVLTRERHGYLDLRGRLALRTDRLVLDVPVARTAPSAAVPDGLAGTAGLEVATALLLEPDDRPSVRALARTLGRSASRVSEILSAFRAAGLVLPDGRPDGPRLFHALAQRWPATRTYLATRPDAAAPTGRAALRLGLDDVAGRPGWALTDLAAAARYGAPAPVRTDHLLDFYVPDQAAARRAVTLLGAAANSRQAVAAIRTAPVPLVTAARVPLGSGEADWPLAHPLFVALDLAQDPGRGSEILADWDPPAGFTRVW